MENERSLDVHNHLEAERAYFERFFEESGMESCYSLLQQEIANIKAMEDDEAVELSSETCGPWRYFMIQPPGKDSPVFCRRLAVQGGSPSVPDGAPTVLLDLDRDVIGPLGLCKMSPDHRHLAFTVDESDGAEDFMLYIKDVAQGKVLQGCTTRGVLGFEWAADGSTFLYSTSAAGPTGAEAEDWATAGEEEWPRAGHHGVLHQVDTQSGLSGKSREEIIGEHTEDPRSRAGSGPPRGFSSRVMAILPRWMQGMLNPTSPGTAGAGDCPPRDPHGSHPHNSDELASLRRFQPRLPSRLYRRSIQQSAGEPSTLVLDAAREYSPWRHLSLEVTRTKDWRFLAVNVNSRSSSEVHLLDAQRPEAALALVEGMEEGVEYYVEHREGMLYAVTNWSDPRGRGGGGSSTAIASGDLWAGPASADRARNRIRSDKACREGDGVGATAVTGQVPGQGCLQPQGSHHSGPDWAVGGEGGAGARPVGRRASSDWAEGGSGGAEGSCQLAVGEYTVLTRPVGKPRGWPGWGQALPSSSPLLEGRFLTDLELFKDHAVLFCSTAAGTPEVLIWRMGGSSRRCGAGAAALDTPSHAGHGVNADTAGPVGVGPLGGVPASAMPQDGADNEHHPHHREPLLRVELPPGITHVAGGANQDWHSPSVRLILSSPITPAAELDVCLTTGRLSLQHQQLAPSADRGGSHVGTDALTDPAVLTGNGRQQADRDQRRKYEAPPCKHAAGPATSAAGEADAAAVGPLAWVHPPPPTYGASNGSPIGTDCGRGLVVGSAPAALSQFPCGGSLSPEQVACAAPEGAAPSTAGGVRSVQGFLCERRAVEAKDGVQVPLTLVYHQETAARGESRGPALLEGYGAYGRPVDTGWAGERLSLLRRGWTLGFAHVRGGGELGKGWHGAGKQGAKQSSIGDFAACAEFMGELPWVSPDRIAARGSSAGALLAAAAANARPETFRALVLDVPFLDVLTTMLDPALPLTAQDFDEWGNPGLCLEDFAAIKSYCPYSNVPRLAARGLAPEDGGSLEWSSSPPAFPACLVTAAMDDFRVSHWEAAKWVARVRAEALGGCAVAGPILLNTRGGGHFGAAQGTHTLDQAALEYAFLLHLV